MSHRILAVRRGTEWATSPVVLVTGEDGVASVSCAWGTFPDLEEALRSGGVYDQTGIEDVVDLVAAMLGAELCELAPQASEEVPRPDRVAHAEESPLDRVRAKRAEREAQLAREAAAAANEAAHRAEAARRAALTPEERAAEDLAREEAALLAELSAHEARAAAKQERLARAREIRDRANAQR